MDAAPTVDTLPLQPTAETPPAARRLVERWHRAECWVAVGAFGFIAGVLILDVIGREAIAPLLKALGIQAGATGVFGAQKMAVFALVLATYAGIGVATGSGAHLVPRVGFKAVPAAWGAAMDRIADVLTGAFLLGCAWYGIEFVRGSAAVGVRAPVLQWEVWPFQLAIPLGFASAGLRYFVFARWPALRPKRPDDAAAEGAPPPATNEGTAR